MSISQNKKCLVLDFDSTLTARNLWLFVYDREKYKEIYPSSKSLPKNLSVRILKNYLTESQKTKIRKEIWGTESRMKMIRDFLDGFIDGGYDISISSNNDLDIIKTGLEIAGIPPKRYFSCIHAADGIECLSSDFGILPLLKYTSKTDFLSQLFFVKGYKNIIYVDDISTENDTFEKMIAHSSAESRYFYLSDLNYHFVKILSVESGGMGMTHKDIENIYSFAIYDSLPEDTQERYSKAKIDDCIKKTSELYSHNRDEIYVLDVILNYLHKNK